MNKKYEFTGEVSNGLKRIRAVRDFGGVRAGALGGWIKSDSNLSHDGKRIGRRHRLVYVPHSIWDEIGPTSASVALVEVER